MKKYFHVYRIEHPKDKDGMWYNTKGESKKQIHILCPNGIAKDLPMPFNPAHRKDNKVWCSAGSSVEQMQHWFTREDALNLVKNGYKLYKFTVKEIQEFPNEVLFCREDIIKEEEINLEEIWTD